MSDKPPPYGAAPGQPAGYYPPPGQQPPPAGYYPPPGQQPPPAGYQQPPPAGYQQPPPAGYYPPPGVQPGGPAQTTTVVTPATTVIVVGNRCPTCNMGVIREDFTVCGIILAILFFPIGILCCLVMRERRCTSCGRSF